MWGLHVKVEVVGHQTIGVQYHLVGLERGTQLVQKAKVIGVTQKDSRPPVAPTRHVILRTRKTYPPWSWHVQILSHNNRPGKAEF